MKQPLLESFNVPELPLDNRMIMAPMTRSKAGEDRVPTELMAKYYRQRSSAGLIISEGTQISPRGIGYPMTPGIHSDAHIAGWKKVTQAVHEEGGRIFAQLWHVGRVSHPMYHGGDRPVAPSAVPAEGSLFTNEGMKALVAPRPLGQNEIASTIDDYVQAAHNAMKAGFDGVEIHGANGYLIEQFLKDGANQRGDRYGGSIKNRCRFGLQVVDAVTDAIGASKTGLRLSPSGRAQGISDSNPQALYEHLLGQLSAFSLAYVHLVEPTGEAGSPDDRPSAAAGYFREAYSGTLIANGGYDRESGNKVIREGQADLVSFGRLFLANPDLPARFKRKAALNKPNQESFYGAGREGYTDYPFMEEDQQVAAE